MTGIPFLTTEPESIVAGDTLKWKREDLTNYPAPTWVLSYEFRAPAGTDIEITATADGTDHSITVDASTTTAWAAGRYSWDAYVKSGSERKRVDRGFMEVERNLETQVAAFDDRGHARKVLDALNAMIEGKALSSDQLSYAIGDRSITKLSPEDLIKWRLFYEREVQREEDELLLEKGLKPANKIFTRFI